jgi:hypothetical protein
MRLSSHGMAGTSHSCQATHWPSVDHVGSMAKSAPVLSRTGQAPSSPVGTTATSRSSTT